MNLQIIIDIDKKTDFSLVEYEVLLFFYDNVFEVETFNLSDSFSPARWMNV